LKTERESKSRAPPPAVVQQTTQEQPGQQEEQQQKNPPQTHGAKQQSTTASESKDGISNTAEKQPAKEKTTKKASKDAGVKVKKDNKEEERRRKQEKEKEEARRTSVVMSLKEAKAELEEIRKAGEAREKLVKELKVKLETETGRFEQEKLKLEEEVQFHKLQTESKQFLILDTLEVVNGREKNMLHVKTRMKLNLNFTRLCTITYTNRTTRIP
jgi:hypothetical protein